MSSVRSRYCGQSFSFELRCVMPADPHRAPKPAKPVCFAPHGTASIFSRMPLSAPFFFLSCALNGRAEMKASKRTHVLLIFMTPRFLLKLAAEQAFLPARG